MTEQERNRRKKVAASLVANNMDSDEKERRKKVADDLIKNNASPSVTSSGSGDIYDAGAAQRSQTNIDASAFANANKRATGITDMRADEEAASLASQFGSLSEAERQKMVVENISRPRSNVTTADIMLKQKQSEDKKAWEEDKANYNAGRETEKSNMVNTPISTKYQKMTDEELSAKNKENDTLVEERNKQNGSKVKQIGELIGAVANDEEYESDPVIKNLRNEQNAGKEEITRRYQDKFYSMTDEERRLVATVNAKPSNYSGITADEYNSAKNTLKTKYGYSDDDITAMTYFYDRYANEKRAKKDEVDARLDMQQHPFLESVASVPTGLAGGVLAAGGIADSYADNKRAGKIGIADQGIDYNHQFSRLQRNTQSARQEFTDTHDFMIGDYDVGDMLYNTALSGLESAAVASIPGGAFILGVNAGTAKVNELAQRGLSSRQSVMGGIAAGTIETVFEGISIENIDALKEVDAQTIKDVVFNIGKSMLVNFQEESATEIANIIYDTIMHGDKSEEAMQIKALVNTGKYTEAQAKKEVLKGQVLQVIEAGASGALMGAGFGAVGAGTSYAGNKISTSATGNTAKSLDMTNAIIAEGQAAPEGSKAQKLAGQLAKKQESGKKVSSYKVGTLAEANAEIKTNATAEESEKMSTAFKQKLHRELAEVDRAEATNPTVKTEGGSLTVDGENFDSKTQQLGEFKGIFKDKDGDNAVKTTDGQEIKVSELTNNIENKTIARLYEQTEGMSAEAANLFIDNWDGETIGEYKRAFDYYYKMGRTGMDISDIRENDTIFGNYLSAEAQAKIANAGLYGREFRKGLTDLSVARKDNRYKYESKVLQIIGEKKNLEIFILDENSKVNGKYFEGTNRIVVYRNAEGKLITRTAGHESFHFIKNQATDEASKADVKALSDLVLDALENNGMDIEAEIKRLGEITDSEGNLVYKTREDCIEEIVADGMFDAFTNEKFAKKLLNENRSVFGKLANKIKEIVAEIKSAIAMLGNSNSVINALKDDVESLDKINTMFDELLTKAGEKYRTEHENGQKNNAVSGEVKNSFAAARRTKSELISQAEAMEKDGATKQEIWKKLGLIRDASGIWVYEIDDSAMKIYPNGDARLRKEEGYKRMTALFNKAFVDGVQLTESEQNEYSELDEKYRHIKKLSVFLNDFISHDELFKEYPELNGASFEFDDLKSRNARGYYDQGIKAIVLDESLKKQIETRQLDNTAIHEIQHAIQHIDGRTGGSSAEYWAKKNVKKLHEMQNNIVDMKAERANLFANADNELQRRIREVNNANWYDIVSDGKTEQDILRDKLLADDTTGIYQKSLDMDFEIQKLEAELEYFRSTATAEDMYYNTAGEIEARETANRLRMTAEERAKKMPDLGWERAVFADGSAVGYDIVNLDNGMSYVKATKKVIFGENFRDMRRQITSFIKQNIREGKDLVLSTVEGDTLTITEDTQNKARDNYVVVNGKRKRLTDDEFLVKIHAAAHIDELAEISKQYSKPKTDRKNHSIAKDGFVYRTVYFEDYDGEYYKLTLSIGNNNGIATVYNIGQIKKDSLPGGNIVSAIGSKAMDNLSDNSISEKSETVKEKFSMKTQTEEKGELIAVHNIGSENLMKAINLGGFPMPSVAVTKASTGHSEFGNISVVFNKNAIDPEVNPKNKVYSGDAYTPTFPKINYKSSENVREKVRKKLTELVPYEVQRELGAIHLDANNIETELNNNGGDVVRMFKNNVSMKYAFLLDTGKKIELPMTEKKISRWGNIENGAFIKIAERVSQDKLLTVLNGDRADRYKYEPEIRKAVNDFLKEYYAEHPDWVEGLSHKDEMPLGQLMEYADGALTYLKKGIEKTVDYYKAKDIINQKVDNSKYEDWVRKLFDGIVEKEGIRNNKDLFTPSGNRRKFEALHYDVTLDRIISAMQEQGEKGVGTFGIKNIFGASTKEYSSLNEVRASKERLSKIDPDTYSAMRKELSDRLYNLAYKLAKHSEGTTDASNVLVEAVSKYTSRSGIANYIRREGQGWTNYSEDVVDELIEIVNDIRNLPTEYFEAKPQRAVKFDEVEFVALPTDASSELINALKENDVEIRMYKAGDEQSRIDVLNSKPEILFSTKQTSPIQAHWAEAIRENHHFRNIMTLIDEMQIGGGKVQLSSKDIDRIARDILKTTSSRYDKAKLSDELTVLYDYMANVGKNADTEEIFSNLLNISNGILQQSEMKDSELFEQYKDIRSFLREQRIYITPELKKEIEYQFGNYKSFRNALMGKVMHLTTTDSTAPTLDEVWQELSEKAPEYFPKDFNEKDMPLQLAAFYEAIAPKVVNPYEHFNENIEDAAAEVATEIFQKYYEIERLKTPQGKYQNLVFENMRKLETHKKALRNEFRSKTQENEQRLFESYRERVTEYKQQREEADRRRRLKNELERNYNYLNRRITNETDNDHIPENLKDFVKAFRFIVPDSNGYFSKARLTEFENEYRKLEEKTSFFDADTAERISALKDRLTPGVGAPKMRDLDNYELEELRNISEHVKYIVQNENRLFSDRLKGRIEDYAKTVHNELAVKPESRAQGVPEYNAKIKDKARNGIDSFIKGLTKPEYLFSSLGSDTLKLLFDELRRGENTEARIIADVKTAEQEIKKNFGYDPRWENQNLTIDLTSGKLTVTAEQAMALYATSKRKQGLEHMLNGGVLIYSSKELTKKNGKTKSNIKRERRVFNEADIPKLSLSLTTQQKQYVDAMVEYITNDIGKKRNEISLKLNGIEKYKETYYFPVKVDRHFVDTSIGRQEVVSTIKNQSSAKRTVNHAHNPIEITGFTETVNQHIYDSALYCAYVLPINDFKRVYNFRDTEFEGEGVESLIRKDVSVKEDIRRANGVNAIKQIEDFMIALDSGSRYENLMPVSAKLAARAKKVSVMANLSVVVQQPTAVFRAMLYVEPKYFATTANKADIAEMKKWNGCALKKEIGYFDVNMGRTATDYINEYSPDNSIKKDWSFKEKLQNGNVMLAIDQVAGWGASKADEMTWGAIWKACKKQTKAENSSLTGDELNAAAAELFQTVISKTQVYDSVFTKPDYMRRKEGFAMMATSFMSEPLTSLNMLAESVVNAKKAKGSTQQKAARKFCSRAFACYMTSLVVNSALKSLIYTIRDDDDDESFLEKYVANVTEGIVTEPFEMVPYLKDILSIVQGYDLNRTDVAVFASFKDAIDALGSEKKGAYEKIMSVLKAAGQASGIPAYAVIRDGKAIYDVFDKIVDGVQNGFEPTTGRGIINELKETFDWVPFVDAESNYDQLYNAIAKGDERHYKKVYDNLIADGKEDSTINSELASRLAENDLRVGAAYDATVKGDTVAAASKISELKEAGFSEDVINRALRRYKSNLEKEVKEDERIIKAAEARYNMDYDEYERIIAEMVSEGYSEIIVKDAVNSEKIELETKADDFTVEEKELYAASYDLKNAMINGDSSEVRNVYNKLVKEAGKDEAASQVRKYAKSAYKSGDITVSQAERYLYDYKTEDSDDNDVFWEVEELKGGDNYRKYGKLYEAVDNGRNLSSTVSYYTEHGVELQTVKSNITKEYKPKLTGLTPGTAEYREMYDNVIDAFVATGDSEAEAKKKVNKWFN